MLRCVNFFLLSLDKMLKGLLGYPFRDLSNTTCAGLHHSQGTHVQTVSGDQKISGPSARAAYLDNVLVVARRDSGKLLRYTEDSQVLEIGLHRLIPVEIPHMDFLK